jgi:hypothetical protein
VSAKLWVSAGGDSHCNAGETFSPSPSTPNDLSFISCAFGMKPLVGKSSDQIRKSAIVCLLQGWFQDWTEAAERRLESVQRANRV